MKKLLGSIEMAIVLFFFGMWSSCLAGFKMEINENTKGEIGICSARLNWSWAISTLYPIRNRGCGQNQTAFFISGFNYYVKGHNCKLTAEYMRLSPDHPDKDDRGIFTFQVTVGF